MITRANAILVLLFTSMLVLWVVTKEISDQNYFLGIKLEKLQMEIERVQKENTMLNEENLKLRSYTIIYSEAKGMGFTKAQYVVIK